MVEVGSGRGIKSPGDGWKEWMGLNLAVDLDDEGAGRGEVNERPT